MDRKAIWKEEGGGSFLEGKKKVCEIKVGRNYFPCIE
jgi:hypothetical protein